MAKTANTATRSPFSFVSGNVATKADFQTVHEMQNAARTLPANLWTIQGSAGAASGASARSPAGTAGVTFPASGSVEVYRAELYIDPDLQSLDIKTTATLPAAATGTATVAIGSSSVINAHTAGATTTVSASLATSATGTGWQLATITLAQTSGDPSAGTFDRARVRSGTLAASALPSPSGYEDSGQYAIFDNASRVDYAGVGGLWGVSAFTMAGWLQWSASDTGEILRQEDGGSGYVNLSTSGDRLRVQISAPTLASELSTSPTILSARDVWLHVAATYAAGTVVLYVNGAAIASGTSGTIPSSIPAASTPKTEIGTGLLGYVKHLAFWSGTTASAGQVAEIYGGGVPPDLGGLATLAAPTWWVTCDGSFTPELGAGTPVTVGSPTFGGS